MSFRYKAFISYRHLDEDRKWAKWLIQKLETYRTPKHLIKEGIPDRVGRIFRDDDEIPADSSLSDTLENALKDSEFLIVICSPDTPQSKWVRQEIELFQQMGRGDKIIPLLIKGDPDKSFPQELRRTLIRQEKPDGSIEEFWKETEPLAADVRKRTDENEKETINRAFIRIAASLLKVRFDDLAQRDKERELKKARQKKMIWSFASAMTIILFGVAIFGFYQANLEKEKKDNIEKQRIATAIDEIENRANIISKLALNEENPTTAALIALDAWNVRDPRPEKKYTHYLDLKLSERLSKLKQDWVEPNHADPSLSLAAAIVREKLTKTGEIFYRQYNSKFVKTRLSEDRSKLAMGYEDGTYYIEDLNGITPFISGQATGYIIDIIYTNNNNTVHVISSKEWTTIDIASGQIVRKKTFTDNEIRYVTLSPNKKNVAIAFNSGQLSRIDLSTLEVNNLMSFNSAPKLFWPSKFLFLTQGTNLYILDPFSINNNGQKLDFGKDIRKTDFNSVQSTITIVLANNDVIIIDISKNGVKHTINIPNIVYLDADFKIDSTKNLIFTSVNSEKLEIHNYSTLKLENTLVCNNERISKLELSKDNNLLAAGTAEGRICIWDTNDYNLMWNMKVSDRLILTLEFENDVNKINFSARDGSQVMWQWKRDLDFRIVEGCESELSQLFFSNDGKFLFANAGSMGVCRWDLENELKLLHLPSFHYSTDFLPISPINDKMVFTDRYGFVIEGLFPDLADPVIYSSGGEIFQSAGYSIEQTHILGHTIDGQIHIWKRDDPTSSVVLSEKFNHINFIAFSDPNKYITFFDNEGNGYIFDPNDGHLITKIDLPMALTSIAVDNAQSEVAFTTADGRNLSISLRDVSNLPPMITNEDKIKIFEPNNDDIFGARIPIIVNSNLFINDLGSGHLIYQINEKDLGIPELNKGTFKQIGEEAFIAGFSDPLASETLPKVFIHQVPELVARAYNKEAIVEFEQAGNLTTEETRLLSSFWSSETEDWVFKTAIKMVNRCLTPTERDAFNLQKDPPCWCGNKPFPSTKSWIERLGYNPFKDERADGSYCLADENVTSVNLTEDNINAAGEK